MAVLKVSSDINKISEKKLSSVKSLKGKDKSTEEKKKSLLKPPIQESEKDTITKLSNEQIASKTAYQKIKATEKLFKICGIVFLDKSFAAIYRKDCMGLNHIKISLYDKNNILISTAITKQFLGINGYYEFINIPKGKYKIILSLPYDMEVSKQLLQYHYGSKINPKTNSVIINVSDRDITDAFIGLYYL